MWQRFTERARKVVFYSQEEALKYGEGYVSTEHLLLGLLRDTDSTALKVLERLNQSPWLIKTHLVEQLSQKAELPSQDMTLTPKAKRVIDLSYDEARNLNNNYIGTEHMLLGLIREGDGVAAKALAFFGLTLETLRYEVMNVQDIERGSEPRPPKPKPRARIPEDLKTPTLRSVHLLNFAMSQFSESAAGALRRCPTGFFLLQIAREEAIVEILVKAGLSSKEFEELVREAIIEALQTDGTGELLFLQMLNDAKRHANELGQPLRPAHVLLAYLATDTPLAKTLYEHGLTFEQARPIVAQQTS